MHNIFQQNSAGMNLIIIAAVPNVITSVSVADISIAGVIQLPCALHC